MNKIEEFIKKWLYVNYDENFDKIVQDLQSLINSAVLEKDIKIDILEQEVDSWKNVFSKELVEEQKEKDAEIAESLTNNYYPVGSKGVQQYPTKICELLAKAIREQ